LALSAVGSQSLSFGKIFTGTLMAKTFSRWIVFVIAIPVFGARPAWADEPGADADQAIIDLYKSGKLFDKREYQAVQLAKLIDAVHLVPLVLLIDQLEDMANQSAPVERFLKVIDAITAFTDTVPNIVAVLACLEDYFRNNIEKLTKPKHDRLMRDPEPMRLLGNRTLNEIREMTARRLAYLYDTAGVEVDSTNELYPFRDASNVK
jgi:hypothetical protein